MANVRSIPEIDSAGAARPGRRGFRLGLWSRPHEDPESARSRRVILLAGLLGIANAFDLVFTLLARNHESFWESNPIARSIIGNLPAFFTFKIVLVAIGLVIILKHRRLRLTEVLTWVACAVYSILSGIWWHFFSLLG